MIVRTGNSIRLLRQRVTVGGRRDDRFFCTRIALGSHAGTTEAAFELPSMLFDGLRAAEKDAFVRVNADGGSLEHFCGYLSVPSMSLDPGGELVTMKAYSFTRWLSKFHVGQFANQWEVRYWVRNPQTLAPTGWTPALILIHLFAQLPPEVQARVQLGDLRVLHDIADVAAPDVTFRLTDYAAAIHLVLGLVGDVAFRERFEDDTVYLDFYRVSAVTRESAQVEVSQWRAPDRSRANIQAIQGTEDSTDVVSRVQGFGAYRQHMITCRNYVEELAEQSELNPACRLIPDWNEDLEELALKDPALTTGSGGYSVQAAEAVETGTTTFKVTVELGTIPVGSIMQAEGSGELMKVTGFTPFVPESVPPAVPTPAVEATVTVTRGFDETTDKIEALTAGQAIDVRVPGIKRVFRQFRLPATLNGLTIMRKGCLLDGDGEQYPMAQAFKYGAKEMAREDEPEEGEEEGVAWHEGVIETRPFALPNGADLDPDTRRVTFALPAVELKSRRPDGDGEVLEYQRTVVGVTFTVENRDVPFMYDTGAVAGVTNFDFDLVHGLTERWQKNDLHSWRLGTAGMTLRGVEFPCMYFVRKTELDNLGEPVVTEGELVAYEAGEGAVSRSDYAVLKGLCEQVLRERCRRPRSWAVDIPWFSPGYRVGQDLKIRGVANLPRDVYKVTGVEHTMDRSGWHGTTLTVDNVKPPARQSVTA